MAMWNAPRRIKRHEACACRAAVSMQKRLLQLCDAWVEEDLPEIRHVNGCVVYTIAGGEKGKGGIGFFYMLS